MVRLTYILAASHSGSTLLAMLLGAHPKAVTVGELKATNLGDVDRYRCSCGALIRDCQFWRSVSDEMARRGFVFDVTQAATNVLDVDSRYAARLLRPLHRSAVLEWIRDSALSLSGTWRTHLQQTQTRNLALIESIRTLTGAQVVVDSSKLGLRLKYLLRIPSLDVKVIRLIRDGRGVALTYVNPSEYADATTEERRGGGSGVSDALTAKRRLDMRMAAREWRRSNEEADALLAGLPDSQWLEVRYEALCQAPRDTLQKICSFVGIDPDRIVLDFRAAEHHVVGNGMRHDSTSDVRLDERWRTALNDAQLQVFESVAGELNRRYGYR
jgi:hypothetical protein